MKLELAVVITCHETGCHVRMLADDVPVEMLYSSLVKDRIKIQPEQLVAVDTDANPPVIVWRWLRAAVIELTPDIVVVDDMKGYAAKVSPVSSLPLTLEIDDEVWACSTGRDYEMHDIISDGKPTHPNRMLKYITPIIEDIYRNGA